eukprot:gene4465-6714_t
MAKLAARDHVDRFLRRHATATHDCVVYLDPVISVTENKKKYLRWVVLTTHELLFIDNPPRKIHEKIPLNSIVRIETDTVLPNFLAQDIGDKTQHIKLHQITDQPPLKKQKQNYRKQGSSKNDIKERDSQQDGLCLLTREDTTKRSPNIQTQDDHPNIPVPIVSKSSLPKTMKHQQSRCKSPRISSLLRDFRHSHHSKSASSIQATSSSKSSPLPEKYFRKNSNHVFRSLPTSPISFSSFVPNRGSHNRVEQNVSARLMDIRTSTQSSQLGLLHATESLRRSTFKLRSLRKDREHSPRYLQEPQFLSDRKTNFKLTSQHRAPHSQQFKHTIQHHHTDQSSASEHVNLLRRHTISLPLSTLLKQREEEPISKQVIPISTTSSRQKKIEPETQARKYEPLPHACKIRELFTLEPSSPLPRLLTHIVVETTLHAHTMHTNKLDQGASKESQTTANEAITPASCLRSYIQDPTWLIEFSSENVKRLDELTHLLSSSQFACREFWRSRELWGSVVACVTNASSYLQDLGRQSTDTNQQPEIPDDKGEYAPAKSKEVKELGPQTQLFHTLSQMLAALSTLVHAIRWGAAQPTLIDHFASPIGHNKDQHVISAICRLCVTLPDTVMSAHDRVSHLVPREILRDTKLGCLELTDALCAVADAAVGMDVRGTGIHQHIWSLLGRYNPHYLDISQSSNKDGVPLILHYAARIVILILGLCSDSVYRGSAVVTVETLCRCFRAMRLLIACLRRGGAQSYVVHRLMDMHGAALCQAVSCYHGGVVAVPYCDDKAHRVHDQYRSMHKAVKQVLAEDDLHSHFAKCVSVLLKQNHNTLDNDIYIPGIHLANLFDAAVASLDHAIVYIEHS